MLKKYLPLFVIVVLVLWLGFSVIPGVIEERVATSIPTVANTSTLTPTSPSILVSIASPTNLSPPTPTDTSTSTPTLLPTYTPTPPSTDTPTPAATPTPTPTLTPTAEAVVLANELNLRTGPGTVYNVIGVLHQGDTLDIQGRIPSNEWIQVEPVSLDALGWVAAQPNLVLINTDMGALPILTPSPPPPTAIPSISALVPSGYTYPAPQLTGPDDGVGTLGAFPPLFWKWDGELKEDEFFEVRVWHENLPYHAALGWVKQPQFDYNVSGERNGKYLWTVLVVKGKNQKAKDWIKPGWPYPVWDGELVKELSPESEAKFFFFTVSGGGGGPISNPPPR